MDNDTPEETFVAVSYTHLDVYKRQITACVIGKQEQEQGMSYAQVTETLSSLLGHTISGCPEVEISLIGIGMSAATLTQEDVYKRQLYELMQKSDWRPAFIIGVPVGFVNVEAAKELILKTDVPHIVNRGRKGGSNVAAAIVNALLYQIRPV